jgi:hypothetical protein
MQSKIGLIGGLSRRLGRRKWYRYPFLDPALQFRVALIPAVVGLVNGVFCILVLGFYSKESFLRMAAWLPDYVSVEDLAHVQFSLWPRMLVIVVVFELVAVFIFGLFYSHRIAGPAYAIKLRLRELAKGTTPEPLGLRRGSFLTDLAEELNTAISRMRERNAATRNGIAEVIRDLEGGRKTEAAARLSGLLDHLDRR